MPTAPEPELHPFSPKGSRNQWVPAAYRREEWPIFASSPVGNGRQIANISHLYRFFDEHRRLLYIGVTTNPITRWACHRSSDWWHLARFVSLAPVDPGRRIAIEQDVIRAEKPLYNIAVYTPKRTTIELHRGMVDVVDQFRRRLSPEDFRELAKEFATEAGGA
jgi:hypothetical protein